MHKKIIFTLAIVAVFALAVLWRLAGGQLGGLPFGESSRDSATPTVTVGNMNLSSPAFGQSQAIPKIYTCDGQDISPPLLISGVPETAKSLALIVNDPDAPSGNWVHWTVWNLPADTAQVQAAQLPEGAMEGQTDFGTAGYGGPCPPSGSHRYFFQLFALDSALDLSAKADAKALEMAMDGHIVDKAGLVGVYSRE